jgi:ferredoxin
MDKRERVARAIDEAADWVFGEAELYRMADAAIAALEPVTVQEAARVLYEMPKEDRMKVWRATRGCPTSAEFGKWFCKGLRALTQKDAE